MTIKQLQPSVWNIHTRRVYFMNVFGLFVTILVERIYYQEGCPFFQ